jgi:hypothetical protein
MDEADKALDGRTGTIENLLRTLPRLSSQWTDREAIPSLKMTSLLVQSPHNGRSKKRHVVPASQPSHVTLRRNVNAVHVDPSGSIHEAALPVTP